MTAPPRTDEPIALPPAAQPAGRGTIPLVAACVPVIGAVAMWLITGYAMMLAFAVLGPLMMFGSLADGARTRRRDRGRARRELAEACARARNELRERHDGERDALCRRHPDAGRLAVARTLWRHGASELVLGTGRAPSAVRVTGGDGEEGDALRREAAWVRSAPVAVPLRDAGGVCVQGEAPLAQAVARALLLQLCLRASPDELIVTTVLAGDERAMAALPHRAAAERAAPPKPGEKGPFRVACAELPGGEEDATGGEPGEAASALARADFRIAVTARGVDAPRGCGVVLELERGGMLRARRLDDTTDGPGGEPLDVEGIGLAQAERIAAGLARRAGAAEGASLPPVGLAELIAAFGAPASGAQVPPEGLRGRDGERGPAGDGGLRVPIGRGAAGPVAVDLVHDGPHAVVTGMTGSGKSELLTTWIAALAALRTPEEVTFLLADFKGGTAFAPLLALPHVTGLITDLDGTGSRRAVESLRAELRRREAEIAAAGASDIADPRVSTPRLVIVVDEFAALLQDHGDLGDVFTDVAARGRALGMHLVLGTQRAAGVLRDALVANCPLRVSLRVADAADSRAVIGADDAAELPGTPDARGLALVRRAGDVTPERARIARTGAELVARLAEVGARHANGAPRAPWLPPLPESLPFDAIAARHGGAGGILLGLADEPEVQRQPVVALDPRSDRGLGVVGAAATGKTAIGRLVAAQVDGTVRVPSDLEGAWDAIERAVDDPPPAIVIDGLDALLHRFPPDYAQEFAALAETLVREAGASGCFVVVTAARSTGVVERVMSGFERRALLRAASRADHVQAGGDGAAFDPARPPGRAELGGREVQFALPPGEPAAGAITGGRDGAPLGASAAGAGAAPAAGGGAGRVRPPRRGAPYAPARTRAERRALRPCDGAGPSGPSGGMGGERSDGVARAGGPGPAWFPGGPAALVTAGAAARAAALGEVWGRGVRVVALDALPAGTPLAELAGGTDRLVAVGEGEAWLRHGGLLREIRAAGELLVAAECPHELRTVAGERALPPYALLRAGRAWLVTPADRPRRVTLPA
ncbi:FtsK/SpoIIIE domain-containing protein [Microbacterium halophytorum]|uniref:FtsK/SpoIIIE domain-containing protein n=1 Tax=Microbacterium halophytorum TaxID=2067568 RepID=UPI000CFAC572|nr:FtsK/SpoIIIE domain-containing protein [Microbacterium halophytorum]